MNSTEILRHFLLVMGLEINDDTGVLIDQDTKSQISFEGKFVKANTDPNKALYISEYDIKLNPVDPKCTKLMERMFGKFIDDNSSEDIGNIPEVLTYFFDKDEQTDKYRLTMKYKDGTTWVGDWYLNKVLCYLDSIFKIGGFDDIDLIPYDVDQETIYND